LKAVGNVQVLPACEVIAAQLIKDDQHGHTWLLARGRRRSGTSTTCAGGEPQTDHETKRSQQKLESLWQSRTTTRGTCHLLTAKLGERVSTAILLGTQVQRRPATPSDAQRRPATPSAPCLWSLHHLQTHHASLAAFLTRLIPALPAQRKVAQLP
jgi:hypothetical protein